MSKVRIWVDESFHRLLKGKASYCGLTLPKYTKKIAEQNILNFTPQNEKPQQKKFKFNFQI